MNRDFLSNFEEPAKREEKSFEEEPVPVDEDIDYKHGEFPLNICFVWPEGRRHFVEYSRLEAGKINEDYTAIELMFGSEIVELVGVALLPLFDSFMHHKRKYVYCDDARYNELIEDGPIVNQITIRT